MTRTESRGKTGAARAPAVRKVVSAVGQPDRCTAPGGKTDVNWYLLRSDLLHAEVLSWWRGARKEIVSSLVVIALAYTSSTNARDIDLGTLGTVSFASTNGTVADPNLSVQSGRVPNHSNSGARGRSSGAESAFVLSDALKDELAGGDGINGLFLLYPTQRIRRTANGPGKSVT